MTDTGDSKMDREFTPREIAALTEAVKTLTTTMQELPDRLRQEMASTYVRKDVLEPQLKGLEKTVENHSEAFTWIVRIVVGAVILALLGLVLANGGTP